MNRAKLFGMISAVAICWLNIQQIATAQTFGIELQNNLMPASGWMGQA
jgi:hypothetical protein